jgi:hypothetical protein
VINRGVDAVAVLEELVLVLQSVFLERLDSVGSEHLLVYEGEVALHGILHEEEQLVGQLLGNRAVEML